MLSSQVGRREYCVLIRVYFIVVAGNDDSFPPLGLDGIMVKEKPALELLVFVHDSDSVE